MLFVVCWFFNVLFCTFLGSNYIQTHFLSISLFDPLVHLVGGVTLDHFVVNPRFVFLQNGCFLDFGHYKMVPPGSSKPHFVVNPIFKKSQAMLWQYHFLENHFVVTPFWPADPKSAFPPQPFCRHRPFCSDQVWMHDTFQPKTTKQTKPLHGLLTLRSPHTWRNQNHSMGGVPPTILWRKSTGGSYLFIFNNQLLAFFSFGVEAATARSMVLASNNSRFSSNESLPCQVWWPNDATSASSSVPAANSLVSASANSLVLACCKIILKDPQTILCFSPHWFVAGWHTRVLVTNVYWMYSDWCFHPL